MGLSSRRFGPLRLSSLIAIAVLVGAGVSACAPEPGGGQSNPSPTRPAPSASSSSSSSPVPSSSEPAPVASPQPGSSLASVDVQVITAEVYQGTLEVTGAAFGVQESDARCTLSARRGDDEVRRTSTATATTAATYCALLTIGVDELGPGEWEIDLSYESSSSAGSSGTQKVDVS